MTPQEVLISYINGYASRPLLEEEIMLIEKAFHFKKLKRRQYLLQAGDICRYYAFVVSGSLRQYCTDEKGIDQVINFAVENWWIGDRESFFMSTPSHYNIDALEESGLMLITHAELEHLKHSVSAITEMLLELDKRSFIANQKRLVVSMRATAEERYLSFIEQYAEFANRFPLHMIASFLGISTETLSRARSKVFRS